MKVLVLTTMVPFVHGGAEELRDHLVRNLRKQGVEAEAMSLPFTWHPPSLLLEEMLLARNIRISNVDRVIALKFPAYLAHHQNKTLWLLHQYRQAYDLFDAGQSNIPADSSGNAIRSAIRLADNQAFAEARVIFANAPVTANRLLRYNGFNADVLRPPLNDPDLFCGGDAEGYVLAGGRVNAGKRQALLIRALRFAPNVRLVVAGPPDSSEDAQSLRRLAADEGVEDRISFDLRLLPRAELSALVNRATAIAYLPFDEDSVGYVTMEAFHARKPVVTVTDAGGVLDIVKDNETGKVVAPVPEALGPALAELVENAGAAARMGAAGHATLASMRLTWPVTIERLLS